MSLGYTAGYGAAGAAAGLEAFLARRLREQQVAEAERRNREQESIQRYQIGEQGKLREATLAQTGAEREATRSQQLSLAHFAQMGQDRRAAASQAGQTERAAAARTLQEGLTTAGQQNTAAIAEAGRKNTLDIAKMLELGRENRYTPLRDRYSQPQPVQLPDGTVKLAIHDYDTNTTQFLDVPGGGQPVSRPKPEQPTWMTSLGRRLFPKAFGIPQEKKEKKYTVTPIP